MNQEKIKKKEEKYLKGIERQRGLEKVDGHLKRLNYLYRDNPNVYSGYLIEATGKNKNKNTIDYSDYNNYNKSLSPVRSINSNLQFKGLNVYGKKF